MEETKLYGARVQVVEVMEQGLPWHEAAKRAGLQISQSTAYRLRQRMRQGGEQALREGRHGHPVKHIATASPSLSLSARRNPPWHLIADPAERKLAVVRLHSEGWSITSIAEYLETARPTIYSTHRNPFSQPSASLVANIRSRVAPGPAATRTAQAKNQASSTFGCATPLPWDG